MNIGWGLLREAASVMNHNRAANRIKVRRTTDFAQKERSDLL
jgi:hypothetical protein